MSLNTADEVFDQFIKPLSIKERLRLVEIIARDLSSNAETSDNETHEISEWLTASSSSLREIWDNEEDSVYDRL